MIYRTEHPKPQFMRESFRNLNGSWGFEFDFSKSACERGVLESDIPLENEINVPFCPESKLSGINYTDFIPACIYRKEFMLDESEMSGNIFLHFGAVDYKATVYLNGVCVGAHKGGYSSFGFDITRFCRKGTNTLTVYCEDDTRSSDIPSGKQCHKYESYGCFYTRTTGIWQTVWLEFTPKEYIESVRYFTDINSGTVSIKASLVGKGELKARVLFDGRLVGSGNVKTDCGRALINIKLDEIHLWELGKGNLYDVELEFGSDRVKSYFGLREIYFDGMRFMLNGRSIFMRLVLDQGFYPDGIYTAPSDKELENDIIRSMAMGFNGARLHEKVFEERFLYHADRHGYIVWGEYANWGLDISRPESVHNILPEWLEIVNRDINHPSIIGWCPFNETWDEGGRRQCDDVLKLVYLATKSTDPSRPCIDTSGNYHVITDVFDVHDYDSSGSAISERYKNLPHGFDDKFADRQKYISGMPLFISEYGGIGFMLDRNGWGYGNIPESKQAFLDRLSDVTRAILDNKYICGFCYTQLTDVEQECNGLYTYDRIAKFDPAEISKIISAPAAIEE